jgi:hypothetical protein
MCHKPHCKNRLGTALLTVWQLTLVSQLITANYGMPDGPYSVLHTERHNKEAAPLNVQYTQVLSPSTRKCICSPQNTDSRMLQSSFSLKEAPGPPCSHDEIIIIECVPMRHGYG